MGIPSRQSAARDSVAALAWPAFCQRNDRPIGRDEALFLVLFPCERAELFRNLLLVCSARFAASFLEFRCDEIDGGVFDSIAPFDGGFPTTTVFSATYDGGTP